MITKNIYKLIQSKQESDHQSLQAFLKASSKEAKRLITAVCAGHEQFKIKKISILRKYLEFAVCLLRAYQHEKMSKRFNSLKETIETQKSELPADSTLLKSLGKVADLKMAETEEEAAAE